jgi:murein DD-endopeptidase MepM/ murein hydrolase activator NlpD
MKGEIVMKRKWIAIVCIWLSGAVVAGNAQYGQALLQHKMPDHVYAAAGTATTTSPSNDLDQQLDQIQKKQEKLQNEKKMIEKQANLVKDAKGNIASYVKKLDHELVVLSKSISENQQEIKVLSKEWNDEKKELKLAQGKQQEQYDLMKSKIKSMYENTNQDTYVQYLMSSDSLSDVYNRAEYVERVLNYDKVLLSQYQSVTTEVSLAERESADKMDELKTTGISLRYEKKTVKKLLKEKKEQLNSYSHQLSGNKTDISSYEVQIANAENQIESLLAKKRDQISAQEEKNGTAAGGTVLATSGKWAWPLAVSGTITSDFGYRIAPTAGASTYHKGIDISTSIGTSVLATQKGKVVIAQYSSSAGNFISIYHGNGVYSYYMHCSQLLVSVGNHVKKGQIIAKSGSTGVSTGPHLHFGLYMNGNYVNPLSYVKQK